MMHAYSHFMLAFPGATYGTGKTNHCHCWPELALGQPRTTDRLLWQSPRGNRVVTHGASMLRWIWSISEYNLTTRNSPKRTLKSGPFVRERRGSEPEKQQPKHNPCGPLGPN